MIYKVYSGGDVKFIVQENGKDIDIYDAEYLEILENFDKCESVYTVRNYVKIQYDEKLGDDKKIQHTIVNITTLNKKSIVIMGNTIFMMDEKEKITCVDKNRINDGHETYVLYSEQICTNSGIATIVFTRAQKTFHKVKNHTIISEYAQDGQMIRIGIYNSNPSESTIKIEGKSTLFTDGGAYAISLPNNDIYIINGEKNIYVTRIQDISSTTRCMSPIGFKFISQALWWIILSENRVIGMNECYYENGTVDAFDKKLVTELLKTKTDKKVSIRCD